MHDSSGFNLNIRISNWWHEVGQSLDKETRLWKPNNRVSFKELDLVMSISLRVLRIFEREGWVEIDENDKSLRLMDLSFLLLVLSPSPYVN